MRSRAIPGSIRPLRRQARAGAVPLLVTLLGVAGAAAGTWRNDTSRPSPRQGHAVAYDSVRDRLVIFGGASGSDLRNDTWEMDGATFAPGPSAPPALDPRTAHAMAFDATRRHVVLFGGRGPSGLLGDTWEYDGLAWSPGGGAPSAREGHAMAGRPGAVLLFGGETAGGVQNDTWIYDGAAWAPGPASPLLLLPRRDHAMAYDAARGRVVLMGGEGVAGLLGDTWECDFAQWSLGAVAPPLLTPRRDHGLAFDAARQRVVLFGGDDGLTLPNLLDDTWEYTGLLWLPGPVAPAGLTPRRDQAMAYDEAGARTVAYGGDDGEPRNDTWRYDGSAWTEGGPTVPPARALHAMAFDAARGRAVLHGGRDVSGNLLSDTWELGGSTWTLGAAAPAGLTPRQAHVVAFDSARGRTVLFGGNDGARRNDTWEYDGTAWVTGPPAPPGLTPRQAHAAAFDGTRGRVVLFGGDDGALRNDTWEYDGAWTPGAQPPAGLTPRQAHVVAFDGARSRIVLFGGNDGGLRNDTWEYDGSVWVPGPAAPAGLTPRQAHVVAFDGAQGLVIVHGGFDGTLRNDTWEYDGSTWSPAAAAPPGLTARRQHAAAYDAAAATVVIFGGDDGSYQSDTWRYRASCPTVTVSPATLPGLTVGVAYEQALEATGGASPYGFGASGTLPPGTVLSAAGVLSGTPSVEGTYAFAVGSTDANGCAGSRSYVLDAVCAAISVTPAALPRARVGMAYGATISASGATPPVQFALGSGSLPSGLALHPDGEIDGVAAAPAGIFTFDVVATDSYGCTGSVGSWIANDAPCLSLWSTPLYYGVDPSTGTAGRAKVGCLDSGDAVPLDAGRPLELWLVLRPSSQGNNSLRLRKGGLAGTAVLTWSGTE